MESRIVCSLDVMIPVGSSVAAEAAVSLAVAEVANGLDGTSHFQI